jgi:hypothetical protein
MIKTLANKDTNSKDNRLLSLCHDIKNQINLAANLVSESSPFEIRKILNKALDICNSEMGGPTAPFKIRNVLNKIALNSKVQIEINAKNDFYVYSLSEIEFERILVNLIQNSIEANAKSVSIHLRTRIFDFSISISDDGSGISEGHTEQIFENQFTTKPTGHGIGLSSSKEKLKKIKGNLNLIPKSIGAEFELEIPYTLANSTHNIVVLDDDKYQQIIWRKLFEENRLTFFTNETDLMKSISQFNKDTYFYIDQHIPGSNGLQILMYLKRKGFDFLFLNSSEEVSLDDSPYVLANLQKKSPTHHAQ